MTAGNVAMPGQFADDIEITAGQVELSGYFSGDVLVVATDIVFGDNVQFLGDLEVHAPGEVTLPDSVSVGGDFSYEFIDADDIDFQGVEDLWLMLGVGIAVAVIALVLVFGVGAIVIAITGNASRRGVIMMRDHTGKSFLYGLAVIVVGLIGIIIATVIFEPLGMLFILYWLSLMVGFVFAGYAVFTIMVDKGRKPHGGGKRFGFSLIGLLILFVLTIIPILGFFISVAALLVGTGAFFGGIVGKDSDSDFQSEGMIEA